MKSNRKLGKINNNNLCLALIIWLTKSRNRRWAGHVLRMGRKRVVHRGMGEKRKRKVYHWRHGRKRKYTIELGPKKWNGKMWMDPSGSGQGRIKLFGAPRQWKHFHPLFQAVFLSGGVGVLPPGLSQTPRLPVPRQK